MTTVVMMDYANNDNHNNDNQHHDHHYGHQDNHDHHYHNLALLFLIAAVAVSVVCWLFLICGNGIEDRVLVIAYPWVVTLSTWPLIVYNLPR